MEEAKRFNEGKPKMSEILKFDNALEDVVKVMEQGAQKYQVDNWLKGGKPIGEYLDCSMRHMKAHLNGEVYDPDIGTKHLANATWNLLAAMRLCMSDLPSLDPGFDQEAFISKYSKDPSVVEVMDKTKVAKLPMISKD